MTKDYENLKTQKEGIHYSRYIASWINAVTGFTEYFDDDFRDWLKTHKLDNEEVSNIVVMAETGKFEFQQDAIEFLKNKEGF